MTRAFPFLQIDAFTDRALAGNACAVLLDADMLGDDDMLSIARETNLSETAFVRSSVVATAGARYFTPNEEIPLAGHPTIATVFALLESGRISLQGSVTTLTLELRVGTIPIEIYCDNVSRPKIVMQQPAPTFMKQYRPEDILPVFGLAPQDLLPGVPIQTVSTGTPQLMVPVRELDVLKRIVFDAGRYTELRRSGDFFSPHIFCLGGVSGEGNTFARHFGAAEDPFTGSATGGMAAYLWRYGLIQKPSIVAEQGHLMKRPGSAIVEVLGTRDHITGVRVGGMAVTVIKGRFVI